MMIKPPQTSEIADRVADQSWQLLKSRLDLQVSRLNSSQPHSLATEVTIKNQSVSQLLTTILPDLLSSMNKKPSGALSSTQVNQDILGYRVAIMQKAHAPKSIYTVESIIRYLPLISKLNSLNLSLFQPSEDGFFLQPNIVVASFPFPNAPISSEYFKYFELFHKKQISPHKKPHKKRGRQSKRRKN